MSHGLKGLCVFAIYLCASLSPACLWDRDTLAMEMKRFPGAAEAIVGRFERNPPQYYQMRADRLLPVFKSGKATLEELDDLATAYDRLGKDDEAISVMAEKAKRLKGKLDNEHLYRYHANLGTFQVHKWLHDGAKKEDLALAKESLKNIQAAITINSDAHFGREVVQLHCIEWLIESKSAKKPDATELLVTKLYSSDKVQETVKGLVGLMVLGNAWESIDVIHALGRMSGSYGGLDAFADLRNIELHREGKHAANIEVENQINLDIQRFDEEKLDERIAFAKENYEIMRRNAKEYETNRTAFMISKMNQGKHPDTDPDFWNGYKEVPPAVLKKWQPPFFYTNGPFYILGGVLLLLIAGFVYGLKRFPKHFRIK